MDYPILTIKPGFEIHLKNRHHAIFKNAVITFPDVADGSIVEVRAATGEFLCYATYNAQAYICGRAIAFEKGDPLLTMRRNMEQAIRMRRALVAAEDTTAYRLINAEGDALPGLIVDLYGDVVVIQLTTLGMDRLRDWIADTLMELVERSETPSDLERAKRAEREPRGIFEKSTGPARKKEGLEGKEGWIRGGGDPDVEIKERGLTYRITLEGSQKTGLFLDQREMRALVRELASGRTVLDVCSYVAGFSLSALAGGALAADAVDYDRAALDRGYENIVRNGLDVQKFGSYAQDAFEFLRRQPLPRKYDFVILDPPAFAKRSADLDPAKKAYTDLNRMALQILPAGGLLLTCSCSYQVDAPLFQTIVFHAARQARRSVRILQRHRLAMDHPVNIYHPEADYLKSLLLWVE